MCTAWKDEKKKKKKQLMKGLGEVKKATGPIGGNHAKANRMG